MRIDTTVCAIIECFEANLKIKKKTKNKEALSQFSFEGAFVCHKTNNIQNNSRQK